MKVRQSYDLQPTLDGSQVLSETSQQKPVHVVAHARDTEAGMLQAQTTLQQRDLSQKNR